MTEFDMTNIERSNLEAHVDLCSMRYRQLDLRLSSLETKMDGMREDVVNGKKSLSTVIITSTATIITGIIGLITAILLKF